MHVLCSIGAQFLSLAVALGIQRDHARYLYTKQLSDLCAGEGIDSNVSDAANALARSCMKK